MVKKEKKRKKKKDFMLGYSKYISESIKCCTGGTGDGCLHLVRNHMSSSDEQDVLFEFFTIYIQIPAKLIHVSIKSLILNYKV